MNLALQLDELLQARYLTRGGGGVDLEKRVGTALSPWSFSVLEGRLVSVLPGPMSATFSAVFQVIRDAQETGETVAWVRGTQSGFYPPDAMAWGVDLQSVAVIRVRSDTDMWFAADTLIRSGGVGMVVIDLASLESGQRLTQTGNALQHRLAGLARNHHAAVLILPRKNMRENGGALVSLSVQTRKVSHELSAGMYHVVVAPQKDKIGPSNWKIEELCNAPDGLC